MENKSISLSEEASFLLRALGQFNEPVTASKFEQSLPKLSPVKRSDVRPLIDILEQKKLVRVNRQAKKVTYWLPAFEDRLTEQVIELLSNGPLPPSKLGERNSPLRSLPPQGRQQLLNRLRKEKRIFQFPAVKGTGTRLSATPPDANDYLCVHFEQLLKKLQPLSKAFDEAGVKSKEEFYEQADRLWSELLPIKVQRPDRREKISPVDADKLILEGMIQIESAARNGALVSLTKLRKLLRDHFPEKTDFDRAILQFCRSKDAALHRHDHVSSLIQEDKDNLVTDGLENYFIGIALRI